MRVRESTKTGSPGRLEISAYSGAMSTPASEILEVGLCLPPDMGAESAAALLLERVLPAAPVADGGRVLGVVCLEDLLPDRVEGDEEELPRPRARTRGGLAYDPGRGFHAVELATAEVGERMRPCVPVTAGTTSIAEAAALLAGQRLPLLPVIGGDREVIGVVTATAILAWLAGEHGLPVASLNPTRSH